LTLETPLTVYGTTYVALKKERRASPIFLEDVAEEILTAKGLLEEAQTTVTPEPYTYLDNDKIYVLNQEGKLTDDEIDAMMDETITWALIPVKG
jgi:hypothetical protein